MKRTFKNILMILLIVLASLLVFGGCTLKPTLDDVLDEYELVAQVTYYANGGAFEKGGAEKNYYLAEGQKAPPIGSDDLTVTSGVAPQVTRVGYDLVGWYFVELDENKAPVFEDETSQIYKLTNEKVDFSQAMENGTRWVIAAKWEKKYCVHVVMVCEEGRTVEVDEFKGDFTSEQTSFQNGDRIGELYSDDNDKVSLSTSVNLFTVKDEAFTFLRYYEDAACTLPAKSSVTLEDSDMTVYAKFATGKWTRISNRREFAKIFPQNGESEAVNYWIMDDIDCKGMKVDSYLKNFSGKIEGDNHTISNFGVSVNIDTMKVALFGNIKAGASITNVTFENVTMAYTSKTEMKPEVYGVFTSIDENATISNVVLTGSLSFSGPGDSCATNMQGGYDHCLFGGFEKDDDYTGDIKVTLTIGDQTVSNINN